MAISIAHSEHPKENTLGGNVCHVAFSATSSAQLVSGLFTYPTGYDASHIQEVLINAVDADGSTSRGALLWGASTPLAPLAAGTAQNVPIRGGNFYIQRLGGSNVPTILTAFLD